MTNRTPPPHITAALNNPTGGALVARLLTTGHYQWTTEHQLQTALAEWLDGFEVFPQLEQVLSDGRSRVDLLAGGVVIEVKIAGTWTDVVRQLTRYAHCPEVASLILVTTKAGHEAVPDMMAGKPVSLVWVGGDGL